MEFKNNRESPEDQLAEKRQWGPRSLVCGEGWGVRLCEPGSPGSVASPAFLRVELFWVRPQEIPDVGMRWAVSTAEGLLAPKDHANPASRD